MSKPWLETWVPLCDESLNIIRFVTIYEPGPFYMTQSRTHLAASAPDMCRVLLAVEWTSVEVEMGHLSPECPQCCVVKYRNNEHHKECTLDASLTKCGLPDQASRDEARKELGI